MISICSIPRNPQRKPKPNACEVSNSNVSDASFSCSLSMQSRNSSNASVSTGKIPANTIGFTSSKPLMASLDPFTVVVMVSPTFTSLAFLMPVIIYPTSPALTSGRGLIPNFKIPTSSAPYSSPVLLNFIRSFFLSVPLKMR